jgi:hypothetical protein
VHLRPEWRYHRQYSTFVNFIIFSSAVGLEMTVYFFDVTTENRYLVMNEASEITGLYL